MTPATGRAPDDAALWQQAATGQHEAFGVLFDRHSEAVYNYLFRRTADWSAAEDLTAAVFLQAWRRRGQVVFDADSALPWLLGVARLLLRNTVRARTRYQAALSRAGAEPVVPPAGFGDPADDPADLITDRDSEHQMAEVCAPRHRLGGGVRDAPFHRHGSGDLQPGRRGRAAGQRASARLPAAETAVARCPSWCGCHGLFLCR